MSSSDDGTDIVAMIGVVIAIRKRKMLGTSVSEICRDLQCLCSFRVTRNAF